MNRQLAGKVSAAAFEERYSKCADPWHFATSKYENERYQSTLQALSRPQYGIAYEPGCSVGVLTGLLASRAARVIATDVSPSAVQAAKVRCERRLNVEILCEDAASYVPAARLDLVVFSELGYYFEPQELARLGCRLARQLHAQGEFVAVHWLGSSEDHVIHGDAVHRTLLDHLPLQWVKGDRHEHFRIDCWINP